MKRLLWIAFSLTLAAMAFGLPAAAQSCGSPPSTSGSMATWARAYAKWCSCMGGTFDANRGACVGVGRGPDGSNSSTSSDAAAPAEAERQRQEAERQRQEEELRQQEEERQQQEAEEAKRKQEEFERNKQQALRDLKGISGELGLKGLDTGDNFGLKGLGDTETGLKDGPNSNPSPAADAKPTECKWDDQGSSVVDLRCLGLDPNKPITVDWHVVAGKERVFPAQIDPATFQNANYNKGFEALMRPGFHPSDAEEAIRDFKSAQLQRPNDPLVRVALYVAEGILLGRQEKLKNEQEAEQELYRGIAAVVSGDAPTASAAFDHAHQLDPANKEYAVWSRLMLGMEANYETGNKIACRAVGHALVFESLGFTPAEIRMLETASRMFPKDTYLKTMLWRAEHLTTNMPNLSSTSRINQTAGGATPSGQQK